MKMPVKVAEAEELDRDAVGGLVGKLMTSIVQHYHDRPTARSTALEVLNALAVATAVIVAGAREYDDEAEAREFFDETLNAQLAEPSMATTLAALEKSQSIVN